MLMAAAVAAVCPHTSYLHSVPFPRTASSSKRANPLLSSPRATSPHRRKDPADTETLLWNSKIRRCVDDGCHQEAISLYSKMQYLGVKSDYFTYPFVLKACSFVEEGPDEIPKIHGRVAKLGLCLDVYICNTLVAVYMKMGAIESGRQVFDEMCVRDVVSWNSVMSGLVAAGDGAQALRYLRAMQRGRGLHVDRYSVVAGLSACALVGWLLGGREMHCHALRLGLSSNHRVQVSVVDMYFKCYDVVSAERFFESIGSRSVVAWNVVIGGFGANAQSRDAVESMRCMQEEGFAPDSVTALNLLPSVMGLLDTRMGKAIHGYSIRNSFLPSVILQTGLLVMYAKCGELASARSLFEGMANRSLVSWNAMISACAQNGEHVEALELFLDLLNGSLKPDRFTISGVLSACAELMLIWNGRQTHGQAVKLGVAALLLDSLLYMYAKCGDLKASEIIFENVLKKDVILWNMMIMAYAIHGKGRTALGRFSEMLEDGIRPNGSTFVSVLSACSISGLVDEGWKYFNTMHKDYGIEAQIEHYGCMVDLLGRVGDLCAAENFIRQMPLVPTKRIWGSLLTASRNHNNIECAELAAKNIFLLDHNNIGCYVILSNMYADVGRWDDVEMLRYQMKVESSQRLQIRSFVELGHKTYIFTNGDSFKIMTNSMYNVLDFFSKQLGEPMYDYGSTFRIQEAIRKKSISPFMHSARLAVCYCIISTSARSPVLVKKNVRLCNACHAVIKFISKFSQREIIVGDSMLFHHFKDGICSCGDYW